MARQCECGCGEKVRNRFLPGHDARLRSELVSQAMNAGQAQIREEARKRLEGLGWTHFLEEAKERQLQST